jgi:uncharacterized protein with LGFP repeats
MTGEAESGSATVQTSAGSVVIQGGIYAKWRALKSEKTPDGDDVQAHLGSPLGQETRIPEKQGGGVAQLFQRGMIVERADGRAFVVYGAIYDHYRSIGDTASIVGQPISDEETSGRGGRVAHFQNGDIYWHEDFGAREVHGARRKRYAVGGYPFRRSWVGRGVAFCKSMLGEMTKRRFPRA